MRKTFSEVLLLLVMIAGGCGGSPAPTQMLAPVSAPAHVLATISVANPVGIAVNPATNRIYVANAGDGIHPSSVTVIDGNTNSVTAEVNVGPYPCAIAANSLTNKIYVSDGTDSMTVIDGATNSTKGISVSGGSSVCAVAVDTTINRIYSLNGGTATFSVIDGATNNVSVIPVVVSNYGDSLYHLAVNSATHDVYVSNSSRGGSSRLTVMNGTTLQTSTVTLTGVSFSVYDVAVNPHTDTVYVSGGELVAVIDGKTLSSQTITIGDARGLIAVNAATNRVYFLSKHLPDSQEDSVTVMDGDTLSATTVPTGQYPSSIVVDEETNQVYVVNRDSGTVADIDGASNSTASLPAGFSPEHAALNPLTHRLYVTSFSSDMSCGANGTLTVIEGAH